MPQLDSFIFFDGVLTAVFCWLVLHFTVLFYFIPVWVKSKITTLFVFLNKKLLFNLNSKLTNNATTGN